MEGFTIQGEGSYLTINIEEVYNFPETTCHWGGYDAAATLEIKSGNYYVKAKLNTSTGELYEFYEKLRVCNAKVDGSAKFLSYEDNLDFTASYNKLGHVLISGLFCEYGLNDNNELRFAFETDQSFIASTLNELKCISNKYGGLKGKKPNTT